MSLEVERGEFVFIVGQSGSGKSTLLRLALKEENATSGSVFVAGRELSRLPDRRGAQLRREIGTVFQDFRLLPNKTVFQNVAFALQVIGKSRSVIRQTVPETLRIVGLEGESGSRTSSPAASSSASRSLAPSSTSRRSSSPTSPPAASTRASVSRSSACLTGSTGRARRSSWPRTTSTSSTPTERVIELKGRIVRDDAGGEYNSGEIVMPGWDTRPSLDALDAIALAEAGEEPAHGDSDPRPSRTVRLRRARRGRRRQGAPSLLPAEAATRPVTACVSASSWERSATACAATCRWWSPSSS